MGRPRMNGLSFFMAVDLRYDVVSCPLAHLFIIFLNYNSHFFLKNALLVRITSFLLGNVSLCPDHFDDRIHILLADLIASGLHHDTDHRLGAALAHQNTAVIAQLVSDLLLTFFSTCG